MPLKMVKNPDNRVNNIIDDVKQRLVDLDNAESLDKELLHSIINNAEMHQEKLKVSDSLPEHLDEITELRDVLDTIVGLEHVMKQLLSGRIKYIIKQLDEIQERNNSEVLRFVSEFGLDST